MAQIDIEALKPVTRVGYGGSGKGKAIVEAINAVFDAGDNAVTDKEVVEALDLDYSDKKVVANIRNHLFVLRKRGLIELKGKTDDNESVYVKGDGEKKTSNNDIMPRKKKK